MFWAVILDILHCKEQIPSMLKKLINDYYFKRNFFLLFSIIGTGRDRLLIDCGEPEIPEYIQVLKNVVKENNISLTKILLTHWHPDHVGGTKDVLDKVAHKGLMFGDCLFFKIK